MDEDIDYSINHTPERKTIYNVTEDGEREPVGMQIEGHTTFIFKELESKDYQKSDYIEIIEKVLNSETYFTYGKSPDEPYYRVVSEENDWSHYHLAVETNKHIALFVQTSTTESSVKHFHQLLEEKTNHKWSVEKSETDMNGSGPNRN